MYVSKMTLVQSFSNSPDLEIVMSKSVRASNRFFLFQEKEKTENGSFVICRCSNKHKQKCSKFQCF